MRKLSIIVLLLSLTAFGQKKTVDQLRAEAEKSNGAHQALLYAELAELQVDRPINSLRPAIPPKPSRPSSKFSRMQPKHTTVL